MGQCHRHSCEELVTSINSRTNKPFYHCDKHRKMERPYKNAYARRNKLKVSALAKNERRRLRSTFLSMYGGKCICCHIDEEVFLALDHVKNDGSAHKKLRHSRGIYVDAISQYDPERFQILCHNCNFAKYRNGVCPHQLVGQEN